MKPSLHDKFHARFRASFTLVETLVAISISSLLLIFLTTIISNALNMTRRGASSLQANAACAAALEFIASDIDSLVVPGATNEHFHATIERVGAVTNATKIAFLSSSPRHSKNGQAGAVLYRIARVDPVVNNGTNLVYALMRTAATNTDAFENFLGRTNLITAPWNYDSGNDYVISHVVDFRVALYPSNTNTPINVSNKALEPFRLAGQSVYVNDIAVTNTHAGHLEVSVTVLDKEGAKILERGAMPLDTAIKRFGYTMSRKIDLPYVP